MAKLTKQEAKDRQLLFLVATLGVGFALFKARPVLARWGLGYSEIYPYFGAALFFLAFPACWAVWLRVVVARRKRRQMRFLVDTVGPLAISPQEFEDWVCELAQHMGYRGAQVTRRSRDGGFDIVATAPHLKGGKLLVECKQYAPNKKVGSPLVDRFIGVMQVERAHEGWLVTTSEFSAPARDKARAVPHLRLIDGIELEKLHRQYLAG